MDLGNYSQVGSAEKKCEENGAGGEKKEGEEEQTSASEKTKVRRIICPGIPPQSSRGRDFPFLAQAKNVKLR